MSTLNIGKFEVKYKSKRWHALNGRDSADFPAGADGKQKALEHAIGIAFPEVYAAITRMIRKRPFLASRAWKAAVLLITGHVKYNTEENHGGLVGWVRSQSDNNRSYQIGRYDGGELGCGCHDFLNHHAPDTEHGRLCKHIIAFRLSGKLSWQNKTEPTTAVATTFRGRTIQQPVTAVADNSQFADGTAVPVELLRENQLYIDRHGRSAASQEKLVSWVYR